MIVTSPIECPQAKSLFASMDEHLMIAAIFDGYHVAKLFVDNLDMPASACIVRHNRAFVAGNPSNNSFNRALTETIATEYPAGKLFRLYYPSTEWELALQKTIVADREIHPGIRHYYVRLPESLEWNNSPIEDVMVGWLSIQLFGGKMVPDNQHLLVAEIESCNPSLDHFLYKSWGVCAIHAIPGHLNYAGWCLAENISQNTCEVGIETLERFQQQRIASSMTNCFIRYAHEIGFTKIGWHCWADNIPSVKTALKAGFQLEREYSVLVVQ